MTKSLKYFIRIQHQEGQNQGKYPFDFFEGKDFQEILHETEVSLTIGEYISFVRKGCVFCIQIQKIKRSFVGNK